MRSLFAVVLTLSITANMNAQTSMNLEPPRAKAKPMKLEKHGHARTDYYYWLRDRSNPEVLNYLRAENAYTDTVMASTRPLEEKLFTEIKSRIKQTDLSVPYKLDDYYYYTRYEAGHEYPLHCRKRGSLEGQEELMIDGNVLAAGHEFFSLGNTAVSYEQTMLAFATDTIGRRQYSIRFKNLETGEILDDILTQTTANMAWANDNQTLFYARQDPATLRSYRIYRHRVGTDQKQDVLVYEEKDETYSCYVSRTKSKRFMLISSYQTLSSEFRYLDANTPDGEFKVFTPRKRNHEYSVDHLDDYFYIRTNDNAKNFQLMKTPIDDTKMSSWKNVILHRNNILLEDFEIFKDYLVVTERRNGLRQFRVLPWNGENEHTVLFDEPAYAASVGINPDLNSQVLRYNYQSLTKPPSVFDYDMTKRTRILLKQEEVAGGYDQTQYLSERIHAKAKDGTLIPISLVYRKGTERNGTNPLLLYGYGSYGISSEATFSSARLSLLDRGFIFAIAHVRGGEELGREWYDDGKLFKKRNSFTDFIDCAENLVAEQYTRPDRLFAMGGSAGGLLVGGVVNMAPQLFKGAIAIVPFVDVVTTMLDDKIPLTTGEYDEWGNPNEKKSYEYMLAYSPYDNVQSRAYPNMLVMTGLHDSQVQYWEPAKWVAKLRAMKTDTNLLLLKTNMDAGHAGASGRFRKLRETALQYTFLLRLAGIAS